MNRFEKDNRVKKKSQESKEKRKVLDKKARTGFNGKTKEVQNSLTDSVRVLGDS